MSHCYRLLRAGLCAHTNGAGFATSFDSRSKDPAELLILLATPKYSSVGSIKSSSDPFQHDALPDE
jgi:hypothetical protein